MEDKEKEAPKEAPKPSKVEAVTNYVKANPKKISALAILGISFLPQESRDLVSAILSALLGQ